MVTCLMTSRVHSSYSELITYCHAAFRIDKITWKYRTRNMGQSPTWGRPAQVKLEVQFSHPNCTSNSTCAGRL